jgi:hypothetical protein
MLEWIALAAGVGFGIMGLGAYIKSNLESRQREQGYQQRIEELEGIIKRGQQIESERLILEQKKLIRGAKKSAWFLGINALGVFHEQYEDMISLLKRGGSIRALLLDPKSEAFQLRERREEAIDGQTSGRLRAEYETSIAYCKDIIRFSEGKGSFELRLHEESLTEALLIIDPESDNTIVHVNEYPSKGYARGYSGETRVIPKEFVDLHLPYIQKYKNLWKNAKKFDL